MYCMWAFETLYSVCKSGWHSIRAYSVSEVANAVCEADSVHVVVGGVGEVEADPAQRCETRHKLGKPQGLCSSNVETTLCHDIRSGFLNSISYVGQNAFDGLIGHPWLSCVICL